jgi:hypothetical protein
MSKSEIASEFLGICFEQSTDHLYLSQKAYVLKILEKFKMSDCKPCDTPLVPKSTASNFDTGEHFEGPYREPNGALLYLAMTTRPDILFSVNCFGQLQEQPTVAAWSGLKRVLRYLKGTLELKLFFPKCSNDDIVISLYVDADWGANLRDRKSISGYILMLNSCPIIWNVKKQTSIALSSTEAEILALAQAIQNLLIVYNLTKEILGCKEIKMIIYEDNQSAIKAVLNENNCARLKHLDIKLKYIREIIKTNAISVEYISTEDQLADLFTKSLPKPRLCKLIECCGLICD